MGKSKSRQQESSSKEVLQIEREFYRSLFGEILLHVEELMFDDTLVGPQAGRIHGLAIAGLKFGVPPSLSVCGTRKTKKGTAVVLPTAVPASNPPREL